MVTEAIIAYALDQWIGLLAPQLVDRICSEQQDRLAAELRSEQEARQALKAFRPVSEDVRLACLKLADQHERLWVSPAQEALRPLLRDPAFHSDFVEWLQAGGIEEGAAVKQRLLERMESLLAPSGVKVEQQTFLREHFFNALDKAVFADPLLASWRHDLSLQYLRAKSSELQRLAEEAAGLYSEQRQAEALTAYRQSALAAWDIIDLSNLPEGDVHIATQKLLLRQLYMPLRIVFEPALADADQESIVSTLEEARSARRLREAGRDSGAVHTENDALGAPLSIGEKLAVSRRLVVLGDPGGGKTTMLRWLATACLLRQNNDPALEQIPDVQTLPPRDWIPVLIRCRDIGPDDLRRSFSDVLAMHLAKTELRPEVAKIMGAVILARIATGDILLLVDGLDEISDRQVRMMFCQELERTAARYPEASILVTSRIVGYRDMPYRMRTGFSHGVISDLQHDDKDHFARRWIEVTEASQPSTARAKSAHDLIDALHSSDRIERLTGNPMLLTTLALVKRKVGKLPTRRNKLYAEAVSVLLNWNPVIYNPLNEDEALPQLAFLAYEMCRRGVQSLLGDEVLDVLDAFREAYPNIRAVRARNSQEFLLCLEERSSLLMRSGDVWQAKRSEEKAVWEFRHLTFQEYLASRALLEGRYKDRDKTTSLAQQVAPLAAPEPKPRAQGMARPMTMEGEGEEHAVPDAWREALRLLVSDCRDDDVDDVLFAILTPGPEEDTSHAQRPRAQLAAQCLAEEPNVSEATARRVLAAFVALIGQEDGVGTIRSAIETTALEVWRSNWNEMLQTCLLESFREQSSTSAANCGAVLAQLLGDTLARDPDGRDGLDTALISSLRSADPSDILRAALTLVQLGHQGSAPESAAMGNALVDLLGRGGAEAHAAAWALAWLSVDSSSAFSRHHRASHANRLTPPLPPLPGTGPNESGWRPSQRAVEVLVAALARAPETEPLLRRHLTGLLGLSARPRVLVPLLERLDDPDPPVRNAAREALAWAAEQPSFSLGPTLLSALEDHVLARLVRNDGLPEAERAEGLVLLALFGRERPLRAVWRDQGEHALLRQRAAESLGLLASRSLEARQREAIQRELEDGLRGDALDRLVSDEEGWAEHDRRLPLLQGLSRGAQLAASAELPLLGRSPGRSVVMLTLTARKDREGMRLRTELVEREVWMLPLPAVPGLPPQQLELVAIPEGEHRLGSPVQEEGRAMFRTSSESEEVDAEVPRTVRLAPCWMARHPISQAQWRAVAETAMDGEGLDPFPAAFGPQGLWERHGQPGSLPVECVSWTACRQWLDALNGWLGREWSGLGVQGEPPRLALPTESQWEAACRAGALTPFHFGDILDASWANFVAEISYGPSRSGVSRRRLVSNGFFGLVNRWGLAEMHGQVWEWCADPWRPDPAGEGWPADARPREGSDPALSEAPPDEAPRLLRGGSWFNVPHICRSAFRSSYHPGIRNVDVGFRVCCLPPGSPLGA